MPGVILAEMEASPAAAGAKRLPIDYGFVVSQQKVELDIDFATKSLTGRTVISIEPSKGDLKTIRIDALQCVIDPDGIEVAGRLAWYSYEDAMEKVMIPGSWECNAEQHAMQKARLERASEEVRVDGALLITIPDKVRIEELYTPLQEIVATSTQRPSVARAASTAVDSNAAPAPPVKVKEERQVRYKVIEVVINFEIPRFRDGLHFVGLDEGDTRFPHVYTRHDVDPGKASCIFPCVDDPKMRCTWEFSIKCSRTLGDAMKRRPPPANTKGSAPKITLTNGKGVLHKRPSMPEYVVPLSEEEKLLEMVVVCSGATQNEVVDVKDGSKKIVSFVCDSVLAPQHIGFAIGPFEQIDLSEYREEGDGEKLGEEQSLPVLAYCLPGRADEVRHTCSPVVHAMDWFTMNYGKFPFREYKQVFVDDQVRDTEYASELTMCSTRLLFDETIIDPEQDTIRKLVHAVATQWFGVAIVPDTTFDRWVTIGISHFVTGLFMKELCGNNDYMFRQKTLSDRLVELDVNRPSIFSVGDILHLGPFEYDFLALKSQLVMFIFDRRIRKAEGTVGLSKVIQKIMSNASTNVSKDSVIKTDNFQKLCEKVTKYRQADSFFTQWVFNAGCPRFAITQRFNKKRVCVEMSIVQKQETVPSQKELEKSHFLRELKEEIGEVWSGEVQSYFTGSLTIRIHEADGTPYEHIVDIREGSARIEIPYNTKYKRLKRSRRQKERQNQGVALDVGVETADDVLYYCLGDVLQSPAEMQEWGLVDWDADTEARMDQESYEWIRIDADFEWICEKTFVSMPAYMYVSQLQQDRDVVAQQESMLFLSTREPHPLVSTFLIRTLMDSRYFHGIRTMAAQALKNHAIPLLNWVGFRHLEKAVQEISCYPGTKTPRPNDFTDKRAYYIEQSIPRAIAQVRGVDGRCPKHARQFILDQLRFNDNGNNEYSDNFKVANLLTALADSLIPRRANNQVISFDENEEEDEEPRRFRDTVIDELDRYRRIDEWTNSYHNIYTVTVLDCKRRLMRAKVILTDPLEFAQYLHDGTSDFVRTKAFEALMDLGLIRNGPLTTLLLNVASTDSSPYVRRQLFEVFCLGLATVALEEHQKPEEPSVVPDGEGDALIIDQGASNIDARRLRLLRTSSVSGAMNALKETMGSNPVLKEATWRAVKSAYINVAEQLDLLDVCSALYEAVESWVVKIPYPRFWEAKHLGKGVIVFKQHIRTTSRKKKKAPTPTVQVAVPPLRLNLNTGAMKPPKRPLPPDRNPSNISDGERPRKLLKFKVDPEKVAAIQSSPPRPATSRTVSASPAPGQSSAIPASPAQSTNSVSPSSLSQPSAGPPVKIRKPLPDAAPPPPPPEQPPLVRKPSGTGIKLIFKTSTSPTE